VHHNADIYYKDVPDGVNSLVIGKLGDYEDPLCIVGGNCSIQGFDKEGNEMFWTVTGDKVTALSLCDTNGDGLKELLVGSEDYEIRIFQASFEIYQYDLKLTSGFI
jgi:Bardet-Biedl syndrome 2 protein